MHRELWRAESVSTSPIEFLRSSSIYSFSVLVLTLVILILMLFFKEISIVIDAIVSRVLNVSSRFWVFSIILLVTSNLIFVKFTQDFAS